MYDVIIVGKGPAGISASIYIKRAGLNCLVVGKSIGALEKADKIENYYGFVEPICGKELINNGIDQATRLGVSIHDEEVLSIEYSNHFIVKTTKEQYESYAVILATGVNRAVPPIKGIKEFEGKGVSYCAVCDAFFYRGKDVAVLGDGDYAYHEAMELLPVAHSVTILTNGREIRGKRNDSIQVNETKVREFRGAQTIEEVQFEDESQLAIAGVFIAEGTASSTDFARKLGAQTNGKTILVDENMKTTIDGLYAAGDCTGGLLQISKAVYEGAKAGTEVIKFVRKKKEKE